MTRDEMIDRLQVATGWIAASYGATNPHVAPQMQQAERYLADVLAALRSRPAPPDDLALRHAWEAGFRLCRSYGDNHHHFDGEQKERRWRDYVNGLAAPAPVAAPAPETPARKPFKMNVSREWVMNMAQHEAETLGVAPETPADDVRVLRYRVVPATIQPVTDEPYIDDPPAPETPPDVVEGQCQRCGERDGTHASDCRHWTCGHCGHNRAAHRDGVASRLERDGHFHPCRAAQESSDRCGYVHADGWTCGRAKGHPSVHVQPSRMTNPPETPAPDAMPAKCADGHEWSNQFGEDWTPDVGTPCDCGAKRWRRQEAQP